MTESKKCTATCRDGSDCEAWAVTGEEKCRMHLGKSADGESHANNGNAETYALHSDTETWFKRHRDEVAEDVRLLVQKWMRAAPFGWASGNVTLLVDCAISEMQMRQADKKVQEEGVIVEQVVGQTESGRPIRKEQEHPALLPKSRLQKDTVRTLKNLGVFEPEQHEISHSGDVGGEFAVNITHHRVTEDDTEDA